MSDQICLNLNVMLRSSTQAAMVLVFMFSASWRLTIVTFVMIPMVLLICKVRWMGGCRGCSGCNGNVWLTRGMAGLPSRHLASCCRYSSPAAASWCPFSKHPKLTSVFPIPRPLLLLQLYGAYYRRMSKKVQTELAEANSVAEEALSSMTTVKAHAAEDSTLVAYAAKLHRFYVLQQRCVCVCV